LRAFANFKDLYPLYRKPSFYRYQVRYAVQSAYKRTQDKPSSHRFKSLTGKKAPDASFWDTVPFAEKKGGLGKAPKRASAAGVIREEEAAVPTVEKGVVVAAEDLIRIFEYALGQEETGKSFFQTSLERMGWGAAVSAFTTLIEEEEHHIAFIKKILEGLKKDGADKLKLGRKRKMKGADFFSARAKSEFLQQLLQESMIPDVTVFSIAWLIEKDLHEYYEKMATRTEGKAREALLMLAEWEHGHELFFREYRDKLTDIYSKMPWGG
jgi:rubrerythrin